jgi:hypothetical protein
MPSLLLQFIYPGTSQDQSPRCGTKSAAERDIEVASYLGDAFVTELAEQRRRQVVLNVCTYSSDSLAADHARRGMKSSAVVLRCANEK